MSLPRRLFTSTVLIVLIIFANSRSPAQANVVPSAPSNVVSHRANLVTTSTACGTDAEVQFIGLTVPTGQVLMITGFYFGASSTVGSDTVESELYVTNGNNSDRRFVAPLSGISGASGLYSGLRSQASAVRRESAARPTANYLGPCAESGFESQRQSSDVRRAGETSNANRHGSRADATGSPSPA